jgi:hypothetical protein
MTHSREVKEEAELSTPQDVSARSVQILSRGYRGHQAEVSRYGSSRGIARGRGKPNLNLTFQFTCNAHKIIWLAVSRDSPLVQVGKPAAQTSSSLALSHFHCTIEDNRWII